MVLVWLHKNKQGLAVKQINSGRHKKPSVYLDYAATTPVHTDVLQAMGPYWSGDFHNPSALYWSAHEVKASVEAARHLITRHIGVQAHQLIFTSGATEANNLVIHGVMRRWPQNTILTSAIEHESVLRSAAHYGCRHIPVDSRGVVLVDKLDKLIDDSVVLVSVIHANNEIGTVQPLGKIARLLAQHRSDRTKRGISQPLLLHTDAAQSSSCLDMHVDRLGVDFMTLSSHKAYGPKGVGGLFLRDRRLINPQQHGGGQEWNVRSGTEAVPLIIGFSVAFDRAQRGRDQTLKTFLSKRRGLLEAMEKIPGITLHPSVSTNTLPNIISFSCHGKQGERLVLELDHFGFQVATGSACQAGSEDPSHVLMATGLPADRIASSLRISFGLPTTQADLKQFVRVLGSCLGSKA